METRIICARKMLTLEGCIASGTRAAGAAWSNRPLRESRNRRKGCKSYFESGRITCAFLPPLHPSSVTYLLRHHAVHFGLALVYMPTKRFMCKELRCPTQPQHILFDAPRLQSLSCAAAIEDGGRDVESWENAPLDFEFETIGICHCDRTNPGAWLMTSRAGPDFTASESALDGSADFFSVLNAFVVVVVAPACLQDVRDSHNLDSDIDPGWCPLHGIL